MKKIYIAVLIAVFLFCYPLSALAHSGRTDSFGGHNCRVGACAGTYHYHNGGGSYGGYVPPKPASKMPSSNLSSEYIPNDYGSFTVKINWDRPDGEQWSLGISKVKGADPGPLTDTTISEYEYENVAPGFWYINIKEGMPSGYWSDVSYWTITVPEWTKPAPSPTFFPAPSPIIQPETKEDNQESDSGIETLLGLSAMTGLGIWSYNKSKKDK